MMKMDVRKHISEKIKELRQSRMMSQQDLADLLETSRQNVNRYEAGTRLPKQDMLFRLTEIFNISVNDLFPETEKDEKDSNDYYYYIPEAISAGLSHDLNAIVRGETISIPDVMLSKYAGSKDLIIMKINGDSMDKVIKDESLIAVKNITINELKDGDMVVFSVNGEYGVKYFYETEDKIIFKPYSNNPAHFDQMYDKDSEVIIHGKVVMYITNT